METSVSTNFFIMNYLENYRVVSTWACKEYGLSKGDLEVLFKLHALEYFTWEDFVTGQILLSWDKKRWYRWKNNDWVKVFREKSDKHSRYNVYCLTRKGNTMINKIYRILNGEEPLPTKIVKNAESFQTSYSTKVTATAIKIHNKRYGTT